MKYLFWSPGGTCTMKYPRNLANCTCCATLHACFAPLIPCFLGLRFFGPGLYACRVAPAKPKPGESGDCGIPNWGEAPNLRNTLIEVKSKPKSRLPLLIKTRPASPTGVGGNDDRPRPWRLRRFDGEVERPSAQWTAWSHRGEAHDAGRGLAPACCGGAAGWLGDRQRAFLKALYSSCGRNRIHSLN